MVSFTCMHCKHVIMAAIILGNSFCLSQQEVYRFLFAFLIAFLLYQHFR